MKEGRQNLKGESKVQSVNDTEEVWSEPHPIIGHEEIRGE